MVILFSSNQHFCDFLMSIALRWFDKAWPEKTLLISMSVCLDNLRSSLVLEYHLIIIWAWASRFWQQCSACFNDECVVWATASFVLLKSLSFLMLPRAVNRSWTHLWSKSTWLNKPRPLISNNSSQTKIWDQLTELRQQLRWDIHNNWLTEHGLTSAPTQYRLLIAR